MSSSKTCEFCDKRGLPLLLVRHAVVHANSGAPRSLNMPIALPSPIAYYTKRILRSGYINVFDEARRRWDAYFVTLDGYLFKLLQTRDAAVQAIPKNSFNCSNEGHRAIASCVTIPDPMNASKVWIGFSDVLWTEAIRKRHEDAAFRRRHMTEVDVKKVLKGAHGPHEPIGKIDTTVAEYAKVEGNKKVNLSWTPFPFNHRQFDADRLKRECEQLRPGSALIVTLADPAGIAQELAALTKFNATMYVEQRPDDKRKLAASTAIDQIREAIQKDFELREIAAAENLADGQINANPLGYSNSETVRKKVEGIRNLTSPELKRAGSAAWLKYKRKFDDTSRELWLKKFDEKFALFDKEVIAPLTLGYVAWMKSAAMADYFECNYDANSPESGAVYAQVFTNCIANMQDKKACAELLENWLNEDISEKRNFLLRALVLNQRATIEAIASVSTPNLDWKQIPWDSIFAVHNSVVDQLSSAAQDVSAQLIAQSGGPLVRMLNKIMDGSAGFRSAVMALGVVSAQPIIVIDVVDSAKNFEKYLTKMLIQQHGRPLNENRLGQLVRSELRRREIHGVQQDGTVKRRWVINIDEETVNRMPSNLKPKQSEKYLLRSMMTVEEVEALNLCRWRKVISVDVRRGAVAGILQVASLMKLLSDEEKSLAHDKHDARWRRQAGVAAVSATASEAFGNVIAGRAGLGMKFGQGIAVTGSVVRQIGSKAGILAGLVMAGLDFNKAHSEYKEGADAAVVGAYLGSGLAGAVLTLALVSAWALPVIGVLLLLAIGLGILIEYLKDNPIQDWLERCPWGKLKNQRYPDFATEQAQLQLALG